MNRIAVFPFGLELDRPPRIRPGGWTRLRCYYPIVVRRGPESTMGRRKKKEKSSMAPLQKDSAQTHAEQSGSWGLDGVCHLQNPHAMLAALGGREPVRWLRASCCGGLLAALFTTRRCGSPHHSACSARPECDNRREFLPQGCRASLMYRLPTCLLGHQWQTAVNGDAPTAGWPSVCSVWARSQTVGADSSRNGGRATLARSRQWESITSHEDCHDVLSLSDCSARSDFAGSVGFADRRYHYARQLGVRRRK
jgi:hypothetical protein